MENYLNLHNIEHTKNDTNYIIPNFTCFKNSTRHLFGEYYNYIMGKNDTFNEILDKIRKYNLKYELRLGSYKKHIIICKCHVYVNELSFSFDIRHDYEIDFAVDCFNYINYNVQYEKQIVNNIWIGKFKLTIGDGYGDYYDSCANIHVCKNGVYYVCTIDEYDEFIEFIQKNMSEYLINNDIKIALK